ncbi:FAD-NAD(P)-binding protein [Krasilnikovia cinnamomea]|uniref:FAD-NAD(P)-binding protein n=1 Tax=Krasilnikovia cinnamomea TaxID=349313 RepID=A0A4Q7ZS91_9ACTN|nr:FAD/NAD(P)-binding protein [Krasilnikovia cinnamomea]RZU54047.1 FAD-NAD(P)-binding protein [Krasilnikovia cinnamomea]
MTAHPGAALTGAHPDEAATGGAGLDAAGDHLDVAIVGTGPRGLSVLERLLARLDARPTGARVRIWAFDPAPHGAGRIWRPDQPDWYLMNTVTGEVTMYSGGPDSGPPRAGAGPSLHQWLSAHPDPRWSRLGENDYAPRSVYGGYLCAVYRAVVARCPAGVTVHAVPARVERIDRHRGGFLLTADGGSLRLPVDKVVLTTGHAATEPEDAERHLTAYAKRHPGVRYVRGDSACDLDLSGVDAGEQVGVLGLGLTFFDVVRALTTGRGGRFDTGAGGRLRYLPSGREPRLVAGSRGGLPMLARGANQKGPYYRYRPRFLTESALADARRRTGRAQLDFRRDVLPLVRAEVNHVYFTGLVRQRRGEQAAARFADRHLAGPDDAGLLAEFGVADAPAPDLERLARPFTGMRFADPDAFQRYALDLLEYDAAQARHGNVSGPLKAALDILRDLRGAMRAAVEFGGLRAESHRDDFLGWFAPVNAFVSTGPGRDRIAELCALIRAGVVALAGPDVRVDRAPAGAGFALSSPRVAGSRRVVTTLIDARMPRPSVRRDRSPLTRQLLADGLITEYTVPGSRYAPGGAAVTRPPFHAVGAGGVPDPDLYLLGIPTEGQRWFTQIGNGRPGPMSGFHADADSVAADVLAGVGDAREPDRGDLVDAGPART